ncbi:MAG: hypothetical protein EXS37_02965 [Opitutus sp.]|nr:hypothetical protein [Opitutus sp.]
MCRRLYEPGREIAQISDWPDRVRAIAARTARRDLSLVGGIPNWLLILAEELRRQTGCAALSELAAEVPPLVEVKCDVDCVLVMTTLAELCRYVIGDVVRSVSTEPPRLIYVGRTHLRLSAFGEHVIEKELTDSITEVDVAAGVRVVNFHVAPRFVESGVAGGRGRHEWWIELKPGIAAMPAATEISAALDRVLRRLNDDYDAKRQGGRLAEPIVPVMPAGSFELWLRSRGKWGGQNKMPRCRSDRAIADELARAEAGTLGSSAVR